MKPRTPALDRRTAMRLAALGEATSSNLVPPVNHEVPPGVLDLGLGSIFPRYGRSAR